MNDPPDPANPAQWLTYWKARQGALPVDFKGEVLQAGEVLFVERFLAAGEHLEWIGRSPVMKPTNDFIWLSNGDIPIELKSTKARYATIRGRVEDSAFRASKHGIVKENFIIDVGNQLVGSELRDELSNYNRGRLKYRLSRLWIMSNGVIEQIDLT